jgi:hypothetical protein
MTMASALRIALFSWLTLSSGAFVVAPRAVVRPGVACHVFLPPSILTSAVETFDGSQIVDTVVVSGVFWTSLKAKFVSLIIGQLLATIVFGVVTTVAASQLSKVGDWATTALGEQFKNPNNINGARKDFIRADQVKYT